MAPFTIRPASRTLPVVFCVGDSSARFACLGRGRRSGGCRKGPARLRPQDFNPKVGLAPFVFRPFRVGAPIMLQKPPSSPPPTFVPVFPMDERRQPRGRNGAGAVRLVSKNAAGPAPSSQLPPGLRTSCPVLVGLIM